MVHDRDKGFKEDAFEKALESAEDIQLDPNFNRFATAEHYKARSHDDEGYETKKWPRLPDSSHPGDPFGFKIKPKNVKVWTKTPITEQEKSIYDGLHIHSETNKFGLHSHFPGGKLSGGHTHSPSNRFGLHHHKEINESEITVTSGWQLDGPHTHEIGDNKPCGPHIHANPENFG